jgi:hypothetical protein
MSNPDTTYSPAPVLALIAVAVFVGGVSGLAKMSQRGPAPVVTWGAPTAGPVAFRDGPSCDGHMLASIAGEPVCDVGPAPEEVPNIAGRFRLVTVVEPAPAPVRMVVTVRERVEVKVPTPVAVSVPEPAPWAWGTAPAPAVTVPTALPWGAEPAPEGWHIDALPEVTTRPREHAFWGKS